MRPDRICGLCLGALGFRVEDLVFQVENLGMDTLR